MALETVAERRVREQRLAERAAATWVADLADGHTTIVIAHPGVEPNRDPKFLRENFGINPAVTPIIRLSESRQAPLTHEEKVAERAEIQARDDALAAEAAEAVAAVKARSTAKGGARNTAKAGPEPVTGE